MEKFSVANYFNVDGKKYLKGTEIGEERERERENHGGAGLMTVIMCLDMK